MLNAGRQIIQYLGLGKAQNLPSRISHASISLSIPHGIVPVSTIHLHHQMILREREVRPQPVDPILTLKCESFGAQSLPHHSFNGGFVAALGKDTVWMQFWMSLIELFHPLAVLRVLPASQSRRDLAASARKAIVRILGQAKRPSSARFKRAQLCGRRLLTEFLFAHFLFGFCSMFAPIHRMIRAATAIRIRLIIQANSIGNALHAWMIAFRQSFVPDLSPTALPNACAWLRAIAFPLHSGRSNQHNRFAHFTWFGLSLIMAHRFFLYSSMIRRTNSAIGIPSRLASVLKNFICGAVKEIICFSIPIGYHRVSLAATCLY